MVHLTAAKTYCFLSFRLLFPVGEFSNYLTTDELHLNGDHVTLTNEHIDLKVVFFWLNLYFES